MKKQTKKRNFLKFFTPNLQILLALILGLLAGYSSISYLHTAANIVSEVMIKMLQLVSMPIIFLSIVSTIAGMKSYYQTKVLGLRVLKYTLFTTILAATVALCLYLLIDPASGSTPSLTNLPTENLPTNPSYVDALLTVLPSNVARIFTDNNVVGAVLIALALGFSILSLPKGKKETLHHFFDSLFSALLKITSALIKTLPIGVWAFVTLFVTNFKGTDATGLKYILLYLACVLGANILQGLIVLPIVLKIKGLSPFKIFKGMFGALNIAFFSKSSNASLPVAMRNAEQNLKVSKQISRFSLPLCSTINMNGCAAFILITVLFVAASSGFVFAPIDYFLWIFIATFAAVGNAGIPMGCFFLSSAILSGMGAPLQLMGLILPLYTLVDMVETALNVWSDACVTIIVDKESKAITINDPEESFGPTP